MATDFLLERLEAIASGSGAEPKVEKKKKDVKKKKEESNDKASDAKASTVVADEDAEYKETDELRKAKAARMEEARKAIFNDLREEEQRSNPGARGKNQVSKSCSPTAAYTFLVL